MAELEPCPFCGGEAKYHDSSCAEEICEYVSCLKCNAHSPLMYRKGEAVEWWNRRPSPWHTDTPTEDGYYLCHIQFYSEDYESDEEGYDIPYWFKNGSWEGNDGNVRIIAWRKIKPYKED